MNDSNTIFAQGRLLNDRRERMGMSVAALSERSGVSTATIHRILRGDCRRAVFENIVSIARALGVEIRFEAAMPPEGFKHEQALRKAEQDLKNNNRSSTSHGHDLELHQSLARLLRGTGRKIWSEK